MPLRRLTLRVLVALVTTLSTLQFTLEGSGALCSSSAAERARGGTTTLAGGSHEGHGAPAASTARGHSDAARQEGDHHRAPAQEQCCESMSSCGVTTVESLVERASTARPPSEIPAHSAAMLASLRTAPEPPPPKA